MVDALDEMIFAQAMFQDRLKAHESAKRGQWYYHPLTETEVNGRTLQLIENTKMLAGEAWEAHNETPWRMHKIDYGREMTPDETERCVEELVDSLHFLVNSFILCGYDSAEKIREAFFRKHKTNNDRQDRLARGEPYKGA
jgi:hypothetical protein